LEQQGPVFFVKISVSTQEVDTRLTSTPPPRHPAAGPHTRWRRAASASSCRKGVAPTVALAPWLSISSSAASAALFCAALGAAGWAAAHLGGSLLGLAAGGCGLGLLYTAAALPGLAAGPPCCAWCLAAVPLLSTVVVHRRCSTAESLLQSRGSHRLWPPSESIVTPAPPAIAGAPDLPKTRPQPPLRSGCGYTFWSSRALQPIGRPRCNL
jgi:hypothetical protein